MKALICPVMFHDKTVFYSTSAISKMDKPLSMSLSLLIHVAVFAAAGAMFIKPPQFAVDRGIGSIEVNLVAAPMEIFPKVPLEIPVEAKSDFVEKKARPVTKVVEKPVPSKTIGKDQVTVHSTGGAISEAKPDYLKNPAPDYPESARRRGYEGTVFLTADIDKDGNPVKVEIEKSSGHASLDEAALKAVKIWKFRPGKIGNIPIESTVRVPIRFYLNKNDDN